jgi:sporulation protein YlmC with PRC-barrel domain
VSGGRRLYGALHLLDRQIVDVDGCMAGKVDDVELEPSADGETFHVVAILSGAGALGPRLGGRLGRFVAAVHGRLADERIPARVPFGVVSDLGNHVTVTLSRDQLESNRTEAWTRTHIVDHVPGADRAPE